MNLPYISLPSEISNEEYHRGEKYRDYISSTSLKNYLISPNYAEFARLHPELKKQTDAMLEGTVYHDLMESYTNFGSEHSFPWISFDFKPPINQSTNKPYGYTSAKYEIAYTEQYNDLLARNPGKKICDAELIDTARNMAGELMTGSKHYSPSIRHLLNIGKAEQSHFCEHEGGFYKFRTDLKTRNKIVDWKKTRFQLPKPENFEKVIIEYGYHISAAMYQYFDRIITGKWRKFFWVAQENVPPYDFNIIDASPWAIELLGNDDIKLNEGGQIFMKLLRQHQWCLENNEYSGYSVFIQPDWKGKRFAKSHVPGWYKNKVKTEFFNDNKDG